MSRCRSYAAQPTDAPLYLFYETLANGTRTLATPLLDDVSGVLAAEVERLRGFPLAHEVTYGRVVGISEQIASFYLLACLCLVVRHAVVIIKVYVSTIADMYCNILDKDM